MNKKIWNTSGVKVSDEISSFLAGEDIELIILFLYMISMQLSPTLKDFNQSIF